MNSTLNGTDDGSSNAIIKESDLTNIAIGLPALISGVLGMCAVGVLFTLVRAAPPGNKEMQRISRAIQIGAATFLKLEYRALSVMVCCLYVLVSAAVSWRTGVCYFCGAFTSATCGAIGMYSATFSNARTAAAAEEGLNKALRVAFNSGSIMGLSVVSVGLASISSLLMIFDEQAIRNDGALAGFGMGASTVAIFARVGGGIFTKAADVGADLVGKVEKNLPEDDVRNPATIADNVGDNVGDVAGMGADLYSSFVGSIIASSLLGVAKTDLQSGIALPFWISMSGIFASMIGMTTVRCKEGASQHDLLTVLRTALTIAGVVQVGFIAIIVWLLDVSWKLFGCIIIGLFAGLLIGIISEYFTSSAYRPTLSIAKSSRIGPANVVIEGMSVGMYSCVMPALILSSVVMATLNLAGTYGIALASTGLLSTLAITLATDAYGPVADNAGGIAEMAKMPAQTRHNTDVLDALGNTTAAVGKGFAVASAVLTALSLMTTYIKRVEVDHIDVVTSKYFNAGALVGAMIPYFFGALTMGAVNQAAQAVVIEVRRQFHTIKGLAEGTVDADYEKCVGMITEGALHAMVFPVLLVVLTPIITGIGLGPEFLAGVLIAAIVCGFMLCGMMNAAGGAWDNGKKYIESGHFGGKRSLAHKAAVVGDTIGDPFKDTSGPAINILMKLMSYISVVLAPSVIKNQADFWWAALIVIGVLIFFVPFWTWMTPQGMRPEVVEKTITELQAAREAEENDQSLAKVQHTKEHKEHNGSSEGVVNWHGPTPAGDAPSAPADAPPAPAVASTSASASASSASEATSV